MPQLKSKNLVCRFAARPNITLEKRCVNTLCSRGALRTRSLPDRSAGSPTPPAVLGVGHGRRQLEGPLGRECLAGPAEGPPWGTGREADPAGCVARHETGVRARLGRVIMAKRRRTIWSVSLSMPRRGRFGAC